MPGQMAISDPALLPNTWGRSAGTSWLQARHGVAVPGGRQGVAAELPEAARQAEAEVRRAVAPSAAAVPHAVLAEAAQRYAAAAQALEAPPSAAAAELHGARVVAARPCVGAAHVVAAERHGVPAEQTLPERPAAARVEARQPLERLGTAIPAF